MANTTVPLSEVGVASMAAGLLDDFHLVDLDSDRPIARFMAREFGYTRDEVLQSYPWHPAITRAQIDAVATAPAFGWSYAYNLPDDCLFLHPLRDGGYLDGAPIRFEVESRQILTDKSGPLNIRYTKKLTQISKWSPLMARVLAARLAIYASVRVTGKMQYFDKAQMEYNRAFFEATNADSRERGTVEGYAVAGGYGQDVFTVRGITEG
jgi:hypothetical protein